MVLKNIIIRGARQHNLKNIDLTLPHRKVIAITGVSGSGKSSLAFDTIYAEGQRRYIESLSTYARQFIEKLDRPDLDGISGISPTIAIKQKNTVTSARSTVGTATEILDYLRLLYARIGKTFCPHCHREVKSYSPSEVAAEVVDIFNGQRVYILIPYGLFSPQEWEAKRAYLSSRGFTKVLVDGNVCRIDELDIVGGGGKTLELLLDRIEVNPRNSSRVAEAIELAYREQAGMAEVVEFSGKRRFRFSSLPVCTSCGRAFNKPSPLLFSFNSPYGACPECRGFGNRMEFSEALIVPDGSKTLEERAIDPWARERFEYFHYQMLKFCSRKGISVSVPWEDLSPDARHLILEGGDDYSGVVPFLEKMREKKYKKGHRFFTRKYTEFTTCRSCRGSRLREEAGYILISGRKISDFARMLPHEILEVLDQVDLSGTEKKLSKDIFSELRSRLGFLIAVGLEYLTLDRLTRTLSGGEAQRINLANSLGANLVDTLYVLDEPSVGLHAADNEKLISVVKRLRDIGNTVIIVEHDPSIIRSADYIVDLGPGPGQEGGRVLFSGGLDEASGAKVPESKTLTGVFGKGMRVPPTPDKRKPVGWISLRGVGEHNLRNIDVDVPLGNLVCVTGVSGSGKSTLVVDVLYALIKSRRIPGKRVKVKKFTVDGGPDKILLVDQSPIGSTPRSNPITYIKGFSYIREVFARQKKSILRGYLPGRFSFNKSGGRCPRCQGMGYKKVEMHFMADIFVPCEECNGRRYNRDTLEIEFRGKNISEVLDLTVDEAMLFFDEIPALGEKLWVLSKVGLGYLRLGQPSNTLSGGEAQRIKIGRELAESETSKNLYIMDEPTTGLHMSDVGRLLNVLDDLVDAGHSLIVIEHNMDVIAHADYVIDLGPGGGDKGGLVIACGDPLSIIESDDSKTGKYLREYWGK
ncbi:MAG: excinuclease ABC subunit UvrA [Candidatus Krumholzibacteriota bacterium]|nr:excinuclease ABC subunit UvrA [Candidatus Krumholzibacteriota bacterium]